MAYGPIVTTLKVASLNTSLEFYTGLLGFTVKWQWSENSQFEDTSPPELACVECGEAVLFLSENNGSTHAWLFVELPFVEEVDALAKSCQAFATIAQAPTTMPWGSREFVLIDPDDHRLRFSCPANRTKTEFD